MWGQIKNIAGPRLTKRTVAAENGIPVWELNEDIALEAQPRQPQV